MPGRTLAYAQLLRLPNVFTAMSNIAMAGCATGLITDKPIVFTFVLVASSMLYLAGMVWNDWFDRKDDEKTQPFRPIPSGRVSPRTALIIAIVLTLAGAGLAIATIRFVEYPVKLFTPPGIAGLLIIAIIAYDGFLKRTPVGPVGMGLCRFLNILLGFSAAYPFPFDEWCAVHVAAVIGLYIVGVTWFSRTEDSTSRPIHLTGATVVMAIAILLALAVPYHLTPSSNTLLFPYLLVAFGIWIAIPLITAIRKPTSKNVQMAVKRSILGLILLDAILASAFVGPIGLLIGILLLPARLLGKWVYST